MANLTTSGDLVDEILFLNGEPTDGTSDFNERALIYLNKAYQVLGVSGGGEFVTNASFSAWWWMRATSPGIITLIPAIITGTVSVTNNNTAITFSSAPTPDTDNYFFKVDNHADVFRISAHNAGAAGATLDSIYTGTTNTTAGYRLFQLRYDLPADCLAVIAPMRSYQRGEREVDGMEIDQMDREWPLNTVTQGLPRAFAVIQSVSGLMTVQFSHYGGDGSDQTDFMRLDFEYLTTLTDLTDSASNFPLVPREYRHILSDMGAYYLALAKDDSRAGAHATAASNGISRMIKENIRRWSAFSRREGKILPRMSGLLSTQRALRTESGHIIG